MTEARKNDVGVVIELTIKDQDNAVIDLSSASTLQIKLTKPKGTVLTKTASLSTDGTDGKMRYATVSDDLNEVGVWEAQAYIVIGSSQYHSTILKFHVTNVAN